MAYNIDVNDGLNSLTDQIERAYASIVPAVDEQVGKCNSQLGREPSCGACTTAGCCYQKVVAHLVEVLPLVRHLRRTGLQQPQLRERFLQAGELMEGTPMVAWFDQARPCVFLTAEQRCSVYQFRPVACRVHYAWSEPKLCSPPTGSDEITQLRSGGLFMQFFHDIEAEIQVGWGLGLDHIYLATLPRMVAIVLDALAKPHLTETAFLTYLQQQRYPLPDRLREWVDGSNPFRRRII